MSVLQLKGKRKHQMKTKIIPVRFENEEAKRLKQKVKSEGKTISEYLRQRSSCSPLIEEKLDLILQEVRNAN